MKAMLADMYRSHKMGKQFAPSGLQLMDKGGRTSILIAGLSPQVDNIQHIHTDHEHVT